MKGRPTFFEFVNGMSFNGSKKTVWIKSKKTGEVFGVRGKTAMLITKPVKFIRKLLWFFFKYNTK